MQILKLFFGGEIPGDDPNKREKHKDSVTSLAIAGIAKELGKLQQVISTVVDDHHQGSYPGEVGSPGEHDQADGGVVMDEHLPEILPLDIKELADGQGPVEGQFQHVVPPDIIVHL